MCNTVTSTTASSKHHDVHMDISMLSTAIQEMCELKIPQNQLPKIHVEVRITVVCTHRIDRCSSGSLIRKVALSFARMRGRTSWRMPIPLGAARMSFLFFVLRSTSACTSAASSPSLASVSHLDGGDRGRFFVLPTAFGILTRLRGHPTKASPCLRYGQE